MSQNNPQNIQAVFFDIDGTLLSHPSHTIPEKTFEAFARLKEAGIMRVICTGRSQFELEVLPFDRLQPDAVILLNGMLAFDGQGKVELSHAIDPALLERLLDVFDEKQIPLAMVERERMFLNFQNEDVLEAQKKLALELPEVDVHRGQDLYMAVAFATPEQVADLRKRLPDYLITSWSDFGADIVPKSAGKKAGIEEWCTLHQIDPASCIAFGDGENDIDMFEAVGCGIAMGNAAKAVQAAADEVCEHIDENGIWKALIRHGCIQP